MKNFILSCLAAIALISLGGCCDTERHTTDYDSGMTTDSKDMHPRHHHQSDNQ